MRVDRTTTRTIMMAAGALMLAALPALAATAAGGAPEAAQAMTWREVIRSGGWLMYVLAAMSVMAVAFIVYFFIELRDSEVAPDSLQRAILEALRAGANEGARQACEFKPCPLSAVTLAAMDYLATAQKADPALVKDIMESEGARQAENIQGQTQYLMDIAVIAPMVGLLGTVLGMLKAFSGIADIAQARPVMLAEGLSQALITTVFGLVVGIPAMAFYAYFRRQAAKLVSRLESASSYIMTALLNRRA